MLGVREEKQQKARSGQQVGLSSVALS